MATEEEVVIHIRLESNLKEKLAEDRAALEAFQKSLGSGAVSADAEKASRSLEREAKSTGEVTKARHKATGELKDSNSELEKHLKGLDKLKADVASFGKAYSKAFADTKKEWKDFDRVLKTIGKGASEVLSGLVRALKYANVAVIALGAVAGGAKLIVAGANLATRLWTAGITALTVAVGAATVALGTYLGAVQEVQAVRLTPFFGGSEKQSNAFLTNLYRDRELSFFKKADISTAAQDLLNVGIKPNQIQKGLQGFGDIAATSGQGLPAITKKMANLARVTKLTKESIQPFLGILPQLDAALKSHIGQKGFEFVEDITGSRVKELKDVSNVLARENTTLIGRVKGWARTLMTDVAGPGRIFAEALKNPIDSLGASADQFLTKNMPRLIVAFGKFLPGIGESGQKMFDWLDRGFDRILPTIVTRFDKLKISVFGFFDNIRDGWHRVEPGLNRLAAVWDRIFEGIRPVAKALGSLLGGVLSQFTTKVLDGSNAVNNFGTRLAGFISSLKPLFNDIGDIIAKIVSNDSSVIGVFESVIDIAQPFVHAIRMIVDALDRIGLFGPLLKSVAEAAIVLKLAIMSMLAIEKVVIVLRSFSAALALAGGAEVAAAGAAGGVAGGAAAGGGLARLGKYIGGLGLGLGAVDFVPPVAAAVVGKHLQDMDPGSGGGAWGWIKHQTSRALNTARPGHSHQGFFGPGGGNGPSSADLAASRSDAARLATGGRIYNRTTNLGFTPGSYDSALKLDSNIKSVSATLGVSYNQAARVTKEFDLGSKSAKDLASAIKQIDPQSLNELGVASSKASISLAQGAAHAQTYHDALSNALGKPFNVARAQVNLNGAIDAMVQGVNDHVSRSQLDLSLGDVVQNLVDTGSAKFSNLKGAEFTKSVTKYVTSALGILGSDPKVAAVLGQQIKDTIDTANKVGGAGEARLKLLADADILSSSINDILNGRVFQLPVTALPTGAPSQFPTPSGQHVPRGTGNTSSGIKKPVNDTASSRFAQTLMSHSLIDGMVPGRRTITSGLRNFGLGSLSSDHLTGGALDITGDNLLSYASSINKSGGFAEFHGSGVGRHLHVVPPHGDTSMPYIGSGGGGGSQMINAAIQIYGAAGHDPTIIARQAIRELKREMRDQMERS